MTIAKNFEEIFRALPVEKRNAFIEQRALNAFLHLAHGVSVWDDVGEPSKSFDPTRFFRFSDGSVLRAANPKQHLYAAKAYEEVNSPYQAFCG